MLALYPVRRASRRTCITFPDQYPTVPGQFDHRAVQLIQTVRPALVDAGLGVLIEKMANEVSDFEFESAAATLTKVIEALDNPAPGND